MIWLVLGLVGALLVAIFVIYAMATRRVVRAVGQPTPEEAKIEAKTKADAVAIVNYGEGVKTEVLNADRDGLLARLRDRVRGR